LVAKAPPSNVVAIASGFEGSLDSIAARADRVMEAVNSHNVDAVAKDPISELIILSTDWADMLRVVERVFGALRKARLTLKPKFGADKLDFLGFTLSRGLIQPGPKVHVIKTFPRPRDAHEVRRFLGLTGYFRRFVVNYTKLVAPLTHLTGKDMPYVWEEPQQQAFEELRKRPGGPYV